MESSFLYQMAQSAHFAWIALFGAAMLTLSMIFGGGDHEIDHDADHDHDADAGDGGNMSFLSFKVLWMFMVGFGAGGFFVSRTNATIMWASFGGIVLGLSMAILGYSLMNYLYKRQGNSVVRSDMAVGQIAVVDTPIWPGRMGEVRCVVGGRTEYFQASSRINTPLLASIQVKVLEANGPILVVGPIVD